MPSPISAPLVLSLLSLLPPPSSAPVPAALPAAEPAHTAAAPAGPAAIHPHLLRRLAERGGTVKAWVHLKDKGGSEAERAAALASNWPERSLERRRRLRASPGLVDARDLPLCDAYLAAIEAAGAAPVHQSRWANAVSVVVDEPALRRLAALPFVLRLTPVREADRARDAWIDVDEGEVAPMESLAGDTAGYGLSWDQLQMINVPAVHELGARGAGVVVGVLDTGFVTTHQAFNQPGHQLQVVAAWDFVNNDPVVGVEAGDPETQHVHGTLILGTLASWLQGTLIGAAPEAAYVLCKTERVPYAWQIFTMPQVIIAQAIAIAALPAFSAMVARDDLPAMRASLADTLRGILFLALPATVGLFALRGPIVAMLFERGDFTAESTALVAVALAWYTLGLASHSVVEIVSRAYYALHDTRTPVVIGTAAMALNIAFSLLLAPLFTRLGLPPHGGLALANTLATTLEMVALMIYMRRRLGGLDLGRVGPGLARAALGSALMGGALALWLTLAAPLGAGPYGAWVLGVGGVLIGGAVYAAAAVALRAPEVALVAGLLKRR